VLSHPAWLPRPFPLAERPSARQRLTRHHRVRQLTRLKNDAASYLFLKANGVACRPPGSAPGGAAPEAVLLQDQTVERIAAAPLTERVECLPRGARGHRADREQFAQAGREVARASFWLREALKEPAHPILSGTLQDVRDREAQIGVVGRRSVRELAARTSRMLTVPGVGPVFAASILAEIEDITCSPDGD
jgi:hypothetical protein